MRYILFSIIILIGNPTKGQHLINKNLSPNDFIEDIEYLQSKLIATHPNPYFRISKTSLNKAFESARMLANSRASKAKMYSY